MSPFYNTMHAVKPKNNNSFLWKSETSFRKFQYFRTFPCDIILVIFKQKWKSRRFLDRIVQSAQEQSKKNEGRRAFKCTSFYLKQSCQAMQVVMQYYISRCNKAKKRNKEQAFKPGLYFWAIQTWWLSRMKSGDLAGRKSSAAAVTPPKSRASMGTLIHVSGSVLLGIGG